MKFSSILIVTYGRTGSTLLMGILNSIPGVLIRGENMNLCTGLFEAYQALQATKNGHGKHAQDSTKPFFGAECLDEKSFLQDAQTLMKHQLVPADRSDVECWGFKEIRYTPNALLRAGKYGLPQYLDFLSGMMPSSAFIFLTRNHEQVADSAFWKNREKSEAIAGMVQFEEMAKRWSSGRNDCFWIDYEAMLSGQGRLQEMFGFFGADFDWVAIQKVMSREHSYAGKPENLVGAQRRVYHGSLDTQSHDVAVREKTKVMQEDKGVDSHKDARVDIVKYQSAEELDNAFRMFVKDNGQAAATDMLVDMLFAALYRGKAFLIKNIFQPGCQSWELIGDFATYLEYRLHSNRAVESIGKDEADIVGIPGWRNLIKAEMLMDDKRVEEALTLLPHNSTEVMDSAPIDGKAAFWSQVAVLSAQALTATARYEEAHQVLDAVMNRFQRHRALLLNQKGITARSEGKKWLAVSSFLGAVEADPDFKSPYFGLQFGLEKTPKLWARAEQVLENICTQKRYLMIKPAVAALHRLYEVKGDIEKATQLNRSYMGEMVRKKLGESHANNADARMHSEPDFLIIGAQKCGTSSLFSWIGQHPRTLMPHTKEIGYFATDRHAHGLSWYLSHFPVVSGERACLTGESTPIYFGKTNLSTRQISEELDDAKIIMLLRNPAARTISAYYQRVKMSGLQTPLDEAVDKWIDEYENADPQDLDNINPVAISVYAPRVRKWFEVFGRDKCLVLNADMLFSEPHTLMRQTFSFLGLEYVDVNLGVANAGTYRKGEEYQRAFNRLQEYFEPSVVELEILLNQNTGWINKK